MKSKRQKKLGHVVLFSLHGIIEGCIEKTGRLNMLEWFLLISYSVPLTSVITLATFVLTTVIVFRLLLQAVFQKASE